MYVLVMVLNDSSRLNEVLQTWVQAGVPGITVLESSGVNRLLMRQEATAVFAGFSQFFAGSGRVGHHTLFAVIEQMETAETAVAATEKLLGDLNNPHTGIIFVLPALKTWGITQP